MRQLGFRKGFTLIELLVVIGIISLLAAILFPVFAKAQEKARQATCLNNQRQIAIAVLMYIQDHDESFFPVVDTTPWSAALVSYNDATIYDCPTQGGEGNNGAPEYGFNPHLAEIAIGDVVSPDHCPLTADLIPSPTTKNYTFGDYDKDLDARHNGSLVLTCVDGHAAIESFSGYEKTQFAGLLNKGYDPYDLATLEVCYEAYTNTVLSLTLNKDYDPGNYALVTDNLPDKAIYKTDPTTGDVQGTNLVVEFEVRQRRVSGAFQEDLSVNLFHDLPAPDTAPGGAWRNTGWYMGYKRGAWSSVTSQRWVSSPEGVMTNAVQGKGFSYYNSINSFGAGTTPKDETDKGSTPSAWSGWYIMRSYLFRDETGTRLQPVTIARNEGAEIVAVHKLATSFTISDIKDKRYLSISGRSNVANQTANYTVEFKNFRIRELP